MFALLGTTYGGDPRPTSGPTDLRSAVPLQLGQGAGLSSRSLYSDAAPSQMMDAESNSMLRPYAAGPRLRGSIVLLT